MTTNRKIGAILTAARELVPALVADRDRLETELVSVLQRESAMIGRYDARLDAAESALAAERAMRERLEAGLRRIAGLDSYIDATIQSEGQNRRVRYGQLGSIARDALNPKEPT